MAHRKWLFDRRSGRTGPIYQRQDATTDEIDVNDPLTCSSHDDA